jgi:hypothetical protein
VLRRRFEEVREACHRHGVKFYCGENRLRSMGDNLCCCGIEGLDGFKGNTYNLNHYLYDRESFTATDAMKKPGSGIAFKTVIQRSFAHSVLKKKSMAEMVELSLTDKGMVSQLMPTD